MKRKINILFIFITLFIVATSFFNFFDSNFKNKGHKAEWEPEATDALESFQFFSEIRAFPNIDIPPDKFYKAFEHVKNEMTEVNTQNSPTAWTSIGPNNIGGRSLVLICSPVDTGTIFMGSASGGLWKSTTGGLGANAWTLINTGYPSNAVSSIAIDSVNPNVMYIGTGENYGYEYSTNGLNIRVTRGMYGIGILKTTDGGATWTKSLDWSYQNQRGVWRVIINPKNHNTLYAATSEGVYKSNNAGGTWNQILNYQMVMDLTLNPADTSTLIVSVGDLSNNVPNANVGIYKSSNAGASFVKLSDGSHGLPTFWSGKTTLALYQGNPNFVYASIGNDPSNQSNSYVGLYMSSDNGNTWTIKYNNTGFMTNQGWYNNAFIVKNNDPNSMLLGNLDVYRSTNGGTAFTKLSDWNGWINGATPPGQPESPNSNFSHADQHYFYSNPLDPNKIYSVTDGGLYRSNNFGTSFYSCNGGYVTTQFYATFANSYQDSIFCIGGLQDNRAAFYQGTTAWYKTFVGDGMCCAVNSTNSNTCYTEYAFGDVNRSNNGGVSWGDIGLPGNGSENSYCFATPFICCKSNPTILYGAGTTIYKSINGGTSWVAQTANLNGGKVLSMDCSSTSTDTVYAGVIPAGSGVANIFRTTDGQNWTNVSNGNVPNAYPTDIHVNPNNSRDVFVTFGGFGTGHVYHTTDAGTTWANITNNLPDLPHHCVCIDPQYPQNIYVGNDLGVYVSTNGGGQWYTYSNGMPYALVFDLSVVYPNRHIRAATHGNGIYERSLVPNPLLGIIRNSQLPSDFMIYQNYPNPFNPSTKIKYQLPRSEYVVINVFDVTGKIVRTLVNEKQNAGTYEVRFEANNISSGVYFYKITAGSFSDVKKLMLIK